MSNQRFKALDILSERKPREVALPDSRVSEYYGENVFNISTR